MSKAYASDFNGNEYYIVTMTDDAHMAADTLDSDLPEDLYLVGYGGNLLGDNCECVVCLDDHTWAILDASESVRSYTPATPDDVREWAEDRDSRGLVTQLDEI